MFVWLVYVFHWILQYHISFFILGMHNYFYVKYKISVIFFVVNKVKMTNWGKYCNFFKVLVSLFYKGGSQTNKKMTVMWRKSGWRQGQGLHRRGNTNADKYLPILSPSPMQTRTRKTAQGGAVSTCNPPGTDVSTQRDQSHLLDLRRNQGGMG